MKLINWSFLNPKLTTYYRLFLLIWIIILALGNSTEIIVIATTLAVSSILFGIGFYLNNRC